MHELGMFDRKGALSVEGFEGSGADWLARYKPYIEDGKTVVSSPHKIYGPETNDPVLQLRKRGIDRVILAGMSANLCTESHMREFLEQGFEVAVIRDATAAAQVAEGDGYAAAAVNFRFLANTVWTTHELVKKLEAVVVTESIRRSDCARLGGQGNGPSGSGARFRRSRRRRRCSKASRHFTRNARGSS